ncbi:MAG: pilus assembly protein PilM [Elusimicrobia bacterium]|nr:pilus assembly protein PilM [Elusimicrobiota bacterium]
MGKDKSNQNALGIYISPKEIAIAQADYQDNGKIQVEHLIKIPVEFEGAEKIQRPLLLNDNFFNEKAHWVDLLKRALEKVDWERKKVVITLSSHFSILRYFVMPFIERRYWSKTIPLESKKYIPVSFDEISYDFVVRTNPAEQTLNILFGMTNKKTIEFLLNLLKSLGLELSSIESSACSIERLFSFLNPKHDSSAYIHFSGSVSYMIFSNAGCPVLFRENDTEAASGMSERKRLDIKGAQQFVGRYLSKKTYSNVLLSGDHLEIWKSIAEAESPIPISQWEPAKLLNVKSNALSSLFSIGSSLKLNPNNMSPIDFSGISTAALLEKNVQSYVKIIAIVLSAIILFFALLSQSRLYFISRQIDELYSVMGDASEFRNMTADTVKSNTEKLQQNLKMLQTLVQDKDVLAPKLGLIAGVIPKYLWVNEVYYSNSMTSGAIQSGSKELKMMGETNLSGTLKSRFVEMFHKTIKQSEEFKVYGPPKGSIEFNIDSRSADGDDDMQSKKIRSSGFTIHCITKKGNI